MKIYEGINRVILDTKSYWCIGQRALVCVDTRTRVGLASLRDVRVRVHVLIHTRTRHAILAAPAFQAPGPRARQSASAKKSTNMRAQGRRSIPSCTFTYFPSSFFSLSLSHLSHFIITIYLPLLLACFVFFSLPHFYPNCKELINPTMLFTNVGKSKLFIAWL